MWNAYSRPVRNFYTTQGPHKKLRTARCRPQPQPTEMNRSRYLPRKGGPRARPTPTETRPTKGPPDALGLARTGKHWDQHRPEHHWVTDWWSAYSRTVRDFHTTEGPTGSRLPCVADCNHYLQYRTRLAMPHYTDQYVNHDLAPGHFSNPWGN